MRITYAGLFLLAAGAGVMADASFTPFTMSLNIKECTKTG